MPEDAPGNPGAVPVWKRRAPEPAGGELAGDGEDYAPAGEGEALVLPGKVRGMQAKLHRWAGEDSSRRFGDLFNLVCDRDFLLQAWVRVAGNTGARTAGVDGVTVAAIDNRSGGSSRFLDDIQRQLKEGTYEPSPVRQVLIPKKSGKLRKLGIPTVADRVVQGALKLVLEPVFEADFLPCSYGFRPRRRAHDAIAEIRHFAGRGYTVVLEADIRACFDEIGHNALMERVRRRIKDKRVLALVKAFLKAGIMTSVDEYEDSLTGTPQGGILSPLLANIALSALDEHFVGAWQATMGTVPARAARRRRGLANWRLVRYADDFVVMVHGTAEQAEALREETAAVLAPIGLRLAEEKTRVVRVEDGFDFLGFRIRMMRQRGTNRHYVYTWPSPKSLQTIRDKVAAKTYRSTQNGDLRALLISLNRSLRGWANYFRSGVSKKYFNAVDDFAWHRIMRWLRRKYRGRGGLGMPEMRRRFCVPGSWTFAADGVTFTGASAVTIKRYRYRGAKIPTPWAPQPETAVG